MRCLLLSLLILTCFTTQAQSLPQAHAGPEGVLLDLTAQLRQGSFLIERRPVGSNAAWVEVGRSAPSPRTWQVALATLAELSVSQPWYNLPDSALVQRAMPRFARCQTADSLLGLQMNPLALQAFGLAYYDASGPGRFEYRVSPPAQAGKELPALAVPGPPLNLRFGLVKAEGRSSHVQLNAYVAKYDAAFYGIIAERGVWGQTQPKPVPAETGFRRGGKDSLFVNVRDGQVVERMTYSYALHGIDRYGNRSAPSDTLQVTNQLAYRDLPDIQRVEAFSVTDKAAIRLRWHLSHTKRLRMINVLRAEKYDGPYEHMGSAEPKDTTYLDTRVLPITTYFYKLELNGDYDQPPTSVRFPGMLEALDRLPPPVLALRMLSQSPDSVRLAWDRPDRSVRGYVVYVGRGAGGTLKQATSVIATKDSTVRFTLSLKDMARANQYAIAVAAVNTSYRQSKFGDTLFTRPAGPAALPTVQMLEILPVRSPAARKLKAGPQLVWRNMRTQYPQVGGYQIERSIGKADFAVLYRQRFEDAGINTYIDTTLGTEKQARYRVKAISYLQAPDGPYGSIAVYAERPAPPPPAPAGLQARLDGGKLILRWDAVLERDLQGYKVYKATIGSEQNTPVATLSATQTSYMLTPEEGVVYFVTTLRKDGMESDFSEPVSAEGL